MAPAPTTAPALRPAVSSQWRPVAEGLLILAIGVVPWVLAARLNATFRPDVPWAAVVIVVYLAVYVAWLQGVWASSARSIERQQRLQLWPPRPSDVGETLPAAGLVALLALMYVLWIFMGQLSAEPPDLSPYPTTAYRLTLFIMGPVVTGVVEEAAFRGYMQSGLERRDPSSAIVITSVVFAAIHLTHGLSAVVLLPGLFITSMLYGHLVRRTGSILPGMIIHILGDTAYTYFVVLGGDARLLVAS